MGVRADLTSASPLYGRTIVHIASSLKSVERLSRAQEREGAKVWIFVPSFEGYKGQAKQIENVTIALNNSLMDVMELPYDEGAGNLRVFTIQNGAGTANSNGLLKHARFSQTVLAYILLHELSPDIIHGHGLEAALVMAYLSRVHSPKTATIFTPELQAGLGSFSHPQWLRAGFPESFVYDKDTVEFYGEGSLLKAGFLADTVLFPSERELDEAIMKEPDLKKPGFSDFVWSLRRQGKVYGMSPEAVDDLTEEAILRQAKDITQAYKLLIQALKEGKRGLPYHPILGYLDPQDAARASGYFGSLPEPQRFIERKQLQMIRAIAHGMLASEILPEDIVPANTKDKNLFAKYGDMDKDEQERLRRKADVILGKGELMVIDLAGGMATGFGGAVAKAGVHALYDVRFEEERGFSYLEVKRSNFLWHQRDSHNHLIVAEMVSDDTQDTVISNLKDFAENRGVELILIMAGESQEKIEELKKRFPGCVIVAASMEEVEKIKNKYKDKWQSSMIVPIIKQPSSLLISEDGRRLGNKYQSGHGDFYEVIKAQLGGIMRIFGIKYVLSSNTDNVGALLSRPILGYFAEKVDEEGLQAMAEVAEKFEGDKGGVPAFIKGVFSILEEAFVPKKWKDAFKGRDVFPYLNTNTLWFTSDALLNVVFDLPLMQSKLEKGFKKIESIMAHGLSNLKWMAMVIDREVRFHPAKFLSDLWVTRTDWTYWHGNRLIQRVRWGDIVQKPLMEISKSILGRVEDLDGEDSKKGCIYAHGHHDSMYELKTLVMGGEGAHFNELVKDENEHPYRTECAVRYSGDVAIIYEHKEGFKSGQLVITGKNDRDEITLSNCVIFVPAGQQIVVKKKADLDPYIYRPNEGSNPKITKKLVEDFINNNTPRWTDDQRKRVLDGFFPKPSILNLADFLDPEYIKRLTDIASENSEALKKVFKPTGSLRYSVTFIDGEPYIEALNDSRKGEGSQYPSKASGKRVRASAEKAPFIKAGNMILVSSKSIPDKGERVLVGIPILKDGEVIAFHLEIGTIDEQHISSDKPKLLEGKLKFIIKLLKEQGITDEELITQIFCEIPWQTLLERESKDVAALIRKKMPAVI